MKKTQRAPPHPSSPPAGLSASRIKRAKRERGTVSPWRAGARARSEGASAEKGRGLGGRGEAPRARNDRMRGNRPRSVRTPILPSFLPSRKVISSWRVGGHAIAFYVWRSRGRRSGLKAENQSFASGRVKDYLSESEAVGESQIAPSTSTRPRKVHGYGRGIEKGDGVASRRSCP